MADNNKNPRRTIWLSETEPLSHYDIWLSKNQHLNSDGLPISDTGVLRPCDYIFKVWDCDNWYPIIGFNSTAVNKIDTVFNTTYVDSHNHSHNSYHEFHLPLFTKPENSPSELFDAGTIGEAILEYVTLLEWQNIFEGDAFTNAFEYYFPTIINNGGININTLIKPAEKIKLGGIWADEFSIEDMFPDTEESRYYTSLQINNSDNWIALAKYKYNHNISSSHLDYNLYVNAKDVIEAINNYITNNPGAPGVQPGNDFEWRLANTEQIGGIRAALDPLDADDCRNIPIVLAGPNVGSIWGLPFGSGTYPGDSDELTEYLYLPGWALMEWMKNPYFNQQNPTSFISGWRGTSVRGRSDEEGLWVELDNIALALDGQIPRRKTTNDYVSIEWVDLPKIETYDLLESGSSALEKYVIKGGSNDKHYLNGNGEWTVPSGLDYWGDRFINVDRTEARITLTPTRGEGSFYIDCTNGVLDWKRVKSGEYPTLSPSNHNAGTSYVINGCNEASAAKFFLNGEGGWTEISGGSSGSTSYLSGVGINIDNDDNSININIPDGTTEGLVLSYDGHGDVEWVNPTSLVEGNNINTFVFNNMIYIRPYACIISENVFTLNQLTPVSNTYSDSNYPFIDFTDYQVESPEGVSNITIESEGIPYLQYPSYMHFTTSTKCIFTFPKSMEFIETASVNSSSGEDHYYTNTDYVILLKPNTKYNVTFYKSCIKFETNSNSIFDQEFTPSI